MHLRYSGVGNHKRRYNEENRKRGNRNDLLQGAMFMRTLGNKFGGAVSERIVVMSYEN